MYYEKGMSDDNKRVLLFKLEIGSDKETLTTEQINN